MGFLFVSIDVLVLGVLDICIVLEKFFCFVRLLDYYKHFNINELIVL